MSPWMEQYHLRIERRIAIKSVRYKPIAIQLIKIFFMVLLSLDSTIVFMIGSINRIISKGIERYKGTNKIVTKINKITGNTQILFDVIRPPIK